MFNYVFHHESSSFSLAVLLSCQQTTSSRSMSSNDNEAAAAAAYIDFMLHGRRKHKSTPTREDGAAAAAAADDDDDDDDATRASFSKSSSSPPRHPTRTNKQQQQQHNDKKKFMAALQAFRKTLECDLWATDDILAQVVASIVDLRLRIDLINREIQKRRCDLDSGRDDEDDDAFDGSTGRRRPWMVSSWRQQLHNHKNNKNNFLRDDDWYLAQQHAVRKHEKALQNLRHLLATLSQQHQALGRRLEEIISMAAESNATTTGKDGNNTDSSVVVVCDQCTRIYKVAALDLYAKQTWGQELLGEVVASTSTSTTENHTSNSNRPPQLLLATVADEKIATQWPRSSSQSPWRKILSTQDFPWTS